MTMSGMKRKPNYGGAMSTDWEYQDRLAKRERESRYALQNRFIWWPTKMVIEADGDGQPTKWRTVWLERVSFRLTGAVAPCGDLFDYWLLTAAKENNRDFR